MNIHDATEQAYRNGYAKGKEDAAREILQGAKRIADGVKFKNATEKNAFIEMLEDFVITKYTGGK